MDTRYLVSLGMSKEKILKFINLWLPPLFWAAMIFKFSSGNVPSASSDYWVDFVVKKIGHLLLFATLAILIYRSLIGEGVSRKKAAVLAVITSLTYGISDEIHQMYTQGREARIRDVVIDGFGAGIVILLIYRYISIFPKNIREKLLKIGIK